MRHLSVGAECMEMLHLARKDDEYTQYIINVN